MSDQKKARLLRREVAERMKAVQPMKVVPSKKGLLTVFLFCASLGYATGIAIHALRVRFFHG